MNILKISSFIALALFMCAPQSTHAYFTTGQTVTRLADHAALYTITYSFGLKNEDIFMPVLAKRGVLHSNEETDSVGYTIQSADQTSSSKVFDGGVAIGLALADTPIVDGMYKIEAGTAKEMTLLVLFLLDEGTNSDTDYGLQVEKLPFLVDLGKENLQTRQLNQSELQYYATKKVGLQN